MKPMQTLLLRLGSDFHPLVIVLLVVLLNVFWTLTLDAFGDQFMQVAGRLPIDLQNVAEVLSTSEALEQISAYSSEARALYWSFFILDNAVPLVVFGSISLLWVALLRRLRAPFFQNLLNSPFILLPWGVGMFDIAENVCFILAISAAPDLQVVGILELGLLFVRLKAICLLSTFAITGGLLFMRLVTTLRRAVQTPQPAIS